MSAPGSGPPTEGRAEPDWLALRRAADLRAREAALPLITALADRLGTGPVQALDLGTGTGSNHLYLSEQLAREICWTVVDHDPDLLADPVHGDAVRVQAGIAELPALLEETTEPPDLLTCAALLDVLPEADLRLLAGVIADRAIPCLFSLSVTGQVLIDPTDPFDEAIEAGFNAHQRRGGRAGARAPQILADALPAGWLQEVATPWRLSAEADADLIARYLRERLDAAVEHDLSLEEPGARWLHRRREQLSAGDLRVQVDHVDQLVLPPPAPIEANGRG